MKRMNAGVFPACAVTLATKRPLAEEEILLQSGTIETIKRHMCLPDVNDHFVDSDGDMSRYFIDKEHTSCLDTDED